MCIYQGITLPKRKEKTLHRDCQDFTDSKRSYQIRFFKDILEAGSIVQQENYFLLCLLLFFTPRKPATQLSNKYTVILTYECLAIADLFLASFSNLNQYISLYLHFCLWFFLPFIFPISFIPSYSMSGCVAGYLAPGTLFSLSVSHQSLLSLVLSQDFSSYSFSPPGSTDCPFFCPSY